MFRFAAGSAAARERVRAARTAAEWVAAAGGLDDYADVGDRDAAHVLALLAHTGRASGAVRPGGVALDPHRAANRLTRAALEVRLGRGKEFARSPADATDDGLGEYEFLALAERVCEVAGAAILAGHGLFVEWQSVPAAA